LHDNAQSHTGKNTHTKVNTQTFQAFTHIHVFLWICYIAISGFFLKQKTAT